MDLDVVTLGHDLPENRGNLLADVLSRIVLIERLHGIVTQRSLCCRLHDRRVQDPLHLSQVREVRPAFEKELRRTRVLTARTVQLHRQFLILLHRLIDGLREWCILLRCQLSDLCPHIIRQALARVRHEFGKHVGHAHAKKRYLPRAVNIFREELQAFCAR